MHDRSGETSGAGDTPSAAVRAGEVPELASRGELAMSKSLEHEKEDARHVPTLSAEQASARLEKTLGARWRALSNAEKSRLVESARASFQEAEQRKRLKKADPGASEPGKADPARDDKLAPAERATKEKKLHQARDAPGASPANPPDFVPEPAPAPSPAVPDPPVKRKRGRPKKVRPDDAAPGKDVAAAPASKPRLKKRKPNDFLAHPGSDPGASPFSPDPVSVFIADGPPSFPPGAVQPLDPGAVLPGAAAVSSVAADGVVASAVPPGGAPLFGREVEGVVDGAFAGGYFLTVRVDGCLLRGLVWDEASRERADDARE